MCGIAGIVDVRRNCRPELSKIVGMISPLRHRGPDESGVYLDDDVALGHTRLSIIGIDGGGQPIGNENGDLWIVYNGEAYNYLELREELAGKGHRFRTETDTEVLLHLYEEYGTDALQRINGQFSIAIWDRRKRELFLARDRVGIRPLYYSWSREGNFMFCSEIKGIVAVDGSRDADMEALGQIFVFWTTLPGRTFFKGVKELPPGHFMIVRDEDPAPKPYWCIPYHSPEEHRLTLADATEALRELLYDSVRLRLRADVPVGAYLSGGLDSSIVTSVIARTGKSHLKTFSLAFEAGQFDESLQQQEMIRFLAADNRRIMVTNEEIRRLLPEVIWHCEKPVLRTSPVPMFMLSALVRSEGYKVVLSGEGADEILGGYHIFKEAKVRDYWGRNPASTRRPLLLERLYPYVFQNPTRGRSFLRSFFSVTPEQLRDPFFSHAVRWGGGMRNLAFLSDERLASLESYHPMAELAGCLTEKFSRRDLLSRAQVLEMELFLSNFLLSSQGDRVGMAHSVEMRHPFLDYRLVDFAFRLPAKWKLSALKEKYLLNRAFIGAIPESISRRGKQPYRAPIRELFFPDAPPDYVDELLSERSLREYGYFNIKKVTGLYTKIRNASPGLVSEFENMALIGVLTTQLLHGQFISRHRWPVTNQLVPDRVLRPHRPASS